MLTYISKETILPHLDAHTRQKLQTTCPELRTLLNNHPLKINYMELLPQQFRVDNAGYEVQLRGADADPPYIMLLQVTEYNPTALPNVEYVMYNKTIEGIWEYIMRKILGNVPVKVRTFKIGPDYSPYFEQCVNPIFRRLIPGPCLPLEQGQLEVYNLIINYNVPKVLAALRPILKTESPLNSLVISEYDDISNDHIIKTAKFLQFTRQEILGRDFAEISILSKLINSRIHLETCLDITQQELANLFRNWKESKVAIGNFYTIGFDLRDDKMDREEEEEDEEESSAENEVEYLLNRLKEFLGAVSKETEELRDTRFPECITVPLSGNSEVAVWCEKPKEEDNWFCTADYMVKMKIQRKGCSN